MTEHSGADIWIRRLFAAAVVGCILAQLLVFAYLGVRGFPRYCNSDTFADMQVARRMWEQKSLFPSGWTFGNQCYVVATPVLAALFYGLLRNINLSMVLATEVMTVLILLSFLWLLRAAVEERLFRLVGCLTLMTSVVAPYGVYSINSMLFFSQASFYSCYLITLFVVFGDYIRAFSSEKTRGIAWALSLLLCFGTGMQSLRQTVITILPIAAYELFLGLRNVLQHKKPWSGSDSRRILRVLTYGCANLAGVLVTKLLHVSSAPIFGDTHLSGTDKLIEKLYAIVSAITEITGVDYLLEGGDCSRFIVLLIVFPIILFLAAVPFWLARIKQRETPLEQCWILCVIGILGVFLSTLVLNITLRGIYVFMWFPLVAFSGLILLKKTRKVSQYVITVLVCLFSLGSLYYCYGPYVLETANAQMTDEQKMSQWAVEQGYSYVYGDYWGTAPQIAVCSEGKLDAGCWHRPENVFQVEAANTPQDIYGEAENEKAIYVFTDEDETHGLQCANDLGITLTKVAEFGKYRAYASPIPLMRN